MRDLPPTTPDAEYTAICQSHWAWRELIEAAPVASLDDVRWKAHALQLEAERDPEFDCEGPVSASALALSLANGVLQLASAAR